VHQADFFDREVPDNPFRLADLFIESAQIDAVLVKVLTPNDDSGRHGVLIPKEAYDLFKPFNGFTEDENNTVSITTIWRSQDCVSEDRVDSRYKYYQRYPERRLTRLGADRLKTIRPVNALIVLGRRKGHEDLFEVHVLYPGTQAYKDIWTEVDLEREPAPGLFFLDRDWSPNKLLRESEAMIDFLDIFENIKSFGYVKTLRTGSTGVGYTFETLAGIKENNSREADYRGIEIKTFRAKDSSLRNSKKQDLFLKEPVWCDGLNAVERIINYGYLDPDNRQAWYSTAKSSINSHDLSMEPSVDGQALLLLYKGVVVASWSREAIQQRLSEKLSELVIISAKTRGSGASEEFHYQTLMHCKEPSVDAFFDLARSGSILVEIRMHVGSSGKSRNHGTSFRVLMRDLGSLFNSVKLLRDI
jgi:hypothetical protein